MSEPWNQWYPHEIDIWQGSGAIQILSDTAYRAVHNILQELWKSEDCALEEKELHKASRVLGRYAEVRDEVLAYFDRTEDGRITHFVQRKKWHHAKQVYEARQMAAKKTNKAKPYHGEPSKASRSAEQSEGIAERSADTLTVTRTVTETEVQVSKASPSHPAAQGAVTKHPDLSIYEAYPRKEGKGAAMTAISKAVARLVKGEVSHGPMVKLEAQRYLMRRVLEYARSPVGMQPDTTKIPHPATWFNQKRYDDDQTNWHHLETSNGNRNSKTGGNLDAAEGAFAILNARRANRADADRVQLPEGGGDELDSTGAVRGETGSV